MLRLAWLFGEGVNVKHHNVQVSSFTNIRVVRGKEVMHCLDVANFLISKGFGNKAETGTVYPNKVRALLIDLKKYDPKGNKSALKAKGEQTPSIETTVRRIYCTYFGNRTAGGVLVRSL